LPRFGFVRHAVDLRERLAIGVPDDMAARHLVSAPGRGETAGCHLGRDGWRSYGLHFTGVTTSGVALLELTQPAGVILLGFRSVHGSP
jgi:hypothetical protein